MNTIQSPARRRVLKVAAAAALLAAAERRAALAATAPDYKALVCVFQQGGNDGENTLIRYDAAGYAHYAAIRPPASGINIPRSHLHPIQPASVATPFGFHPACGPLKTLFDQRKLAIVANVGMLAAPSSRAGLEKQGAPRPANLFSHSDQQRALQSADPRGTSQTGWGGRMADRLARIDGGSPFPMSVAMQQWGIFGTGTSSISLTIPAGASTQPAITPDPSADVLANAAMREIMEQRRSNVFDVTTQRYAREGLQASSVVSSILQNQKSIVRPYFAALKGELGTQMLNVALMIEGRGETGLRRQVFHVRHGNYDTHGSQPAAHQQLLTELSQALAAFQDAMTALGLAKNVTTFTLSDFGRTFKPAANKGTDHGWGNYAFVMGDAVRGGDVYGKLVTQALDGPDDLGNAGRWIPTTSLEQYSATLIRWFGIPEADLPYVLPNIGAFADTNLRFMA